MSDQIEDLTRERDYWRDVVRKIDEVMYEGDARHVHDLSRYERIKRLVDDAISGDC